MIHITNEITKAYIAASADLYGDVTLGEDSSIWYQSVIRADHEKIMIGSGSNIQDGCVLHADPGFPLEVGEHVTVGHRAILHGCRIGDGSLIGMGAILLNGAQIGRQCIVAAGAVVTQGMVVPDGVLVMGVPAKVRRPLTDAEIRQNLDSALDYVENAGRQLEPVTCKRIAE